MHDKEKTLYSLFVSLKSGDSKNDSQYCRIDSSHWYQLKHDTEMSLVI